MGAKLCVSASVSVTLRARAHAQGSDHVFGASVSVTLRVRAHALGSVHVILLAMYHCIEQLIQAMHGVILPQVSLGWESQISGESCWGYFHSFLLFISAMGTVQLLTLNMSFLA